MEDKSVSIFKTPIDIRKEISFAKTFMYLIAGLLAVVIITFAVFVLQLKKDQLINKILIDRKGIVYQGASLLSEEQYFKIAAKAHVKTFIQLFYQFSRENVNYNMDRARLLGDKTVDIVYNANLQNKFYQQIIDLGGATYLDMQEVERGIVTNGSDMTFQANFTVFVRTGNNITNVFVKLSGKLYPVSPNYENPQGLSITNLEQSMNTQPQ